MIVVIIIGVRVRIRADEIIIGWYYGDESCWFAGNGGVVVLMIVIDVIGVRIRIRRRRRESP